jgi:hypothetical protein
MTGAPRPVAASAAPRAETVPTEPPIAPAPSSASPQTSGPDEAAVAPRPVGGNRPENNGSASSAGTAAARPSPADAGRLLVRSTPAGAHVLVDGKDAGPTPVTVHDLPSGTHVVRIARDGYTTEERRIAITAARPAQSLEVELTRPRASMDRAAAPAPSTPGTVGRFVGVLVIDSRPSGANVFVDGKLAGRTPVEVSSVDAGSHALRLELDGYQRWTSAVRVVAGERNRVTASLER